MTKFKRREVTRNQNVKGEKLPKNLSKINVPEQADLFAADAPGVTEKEGPPESTLSLSSIDGGQLIKTVEGKGSLVSHSATTWNSSNVVLQSEASLSSGTNSATNLKSPPASGRMASLTLINVPGSDAEGNQASSGLESGSEAEETYFPGLLEDSSDMGESSEAKDEDGVRTILHAPTHATPSVRKKVHKIHPNKHIHPNTHGTKIEDELPIENAREKSKPTSPDANVVEESLSTMQASPPKKTLSKMTWDELNGPNAVVTPRKKPFYSIPQESTTDFLGDEVHQNEDKHKLDHGKVEDKAVPVSTPTNQHEPKPITPINSKKPATRIAPITEARDTCKPFKDTATCHLHIQHRPRLNRHHSSVPDVYQGGDRSIIGSTAKATATPLRKLPIHERLRISYASDPNLRERYKNEDVPLTASAEPGRTEAKEFVSERTTSDNELDAVRSDTSLPDKITSAGVESVQHICDEIAEHRQAIRDLRNSEEDGYRKTRWSQGLLAEAEAFSPFPRRKLPHPAPLPCPPTPEPHYWKTVSHRYYHRVTGTTLEPPTLFPNAQLPAIPVQPWSLKKLHHVPRIRNYPKDFININAMKSTRIPPKIPVPRIVDDWKGHTQVWCPSGLARYYVYKPDFGRVPRYLKERKKQLGLCLKKHRCCCVHVLDHAKKEDFYNRVNKRSQHGQLPHEKYSWNNLLSTKHNLLMRSKINKEDVEHDNQLSEIAKSGSRQRNHVIPGKSSSFLIGSQRNSSFDVGGE